MDRVVLNSRPRVERPEHTGDEPETEAAEDTHLQNLIDNKTYYVPIGQVTKRRNSKILILVLVVITVIVITGLLMAF